MAWNLKKAFKKAAKAVVKAVKRAAKKVWQTVKKVYRVAQELAWRAASFFDFVGSLLNIQPTKHARLKVFVLFDENDASQTPVVDPAIVDGWVQVATDIFKNRMNIQLHPHGGTKGRFVHVLSAPTSMLTGPRSAVGGFWDRFKAALKDRADWFEEHTTDTALGYGGTMYAFVVQTLDVVGKGELNGIAWPWIHNFCLIDAVKPKPTTLAHEMGHLCGVFPHSSAAHNLMYPDRGAMDSHLNRLQKSVIRTARYVTYINARL
jgi:hypothetical protein